MNPTRQLDKMGFIEQMGRLHRAKGWDLESATSKARMREYWDMLRSFCTTEELTLAVTTCLSDISDFPSIAQLKAAVHDRRRQPRPLRFPAPSPRPATDTDAMDGRKLFNAEWRRLKGESLAEPGDAREPEGAA